MNKIPHLAILAALMLLGDRILSQSVNALSVGDTVKGEAWKMIQAPGKKLYILDFWSTGCTGCISAFPKMEQLKQNFSKDLEIILVNSYESENEVNSRLQQINDRRVKRGSKPMLLPALPRINGDTLLKKLFPHVGVPHHVWLDAAGRVLSITHGYNATPEHVKKALDGVSLSLAVKRDLSAEGYNVRKEGLFNPGHAALKPAFYSGFIFPYSGIGSGNAQNTDTVNGLFRRTWLNNDILGLYLSASYNKEPSLRMLVELQDKKRYEQPDDVNLHDQWRSKYVFSYEMVLPIEDKPQIGEILLADLNRFCEKRFGIEGVIKKQVVCAFVLVVKEPGKVKTIGGERGSTRSEKELSWTNTPLFVIGNTLRYDLENLEERRIIVNELDPDSSIMADMKLTVNPKDLQGLKKQLQRYGLDLIREEREIEVLVIRDKKVGKIGQ